MKVFSNVEAFSSHRYNGLNTLKPGIKKGLLIVVFALMYIHT